VGLRSAKGQEEVEYRCPHAMSMAAEGDVR
jgi:hypothetical protein